MCNFGCKGNKTFAKSQIIPVICLFHSFFFVRSNGTQRSIPHRMPLFTHHFSLLTHHFSLITSEALLRFALSPRLLRAEGPSAPCSWPASAVRVTLDVSAAKLLHCHLGSRIQPSVSHFSLITSHFSLITSHSSLLTHHFSLITSFGHLVIWSFVKIENGCCQNRHYNINIYLYIVSK